MELADHLAGQRIACPACQGPFTIPLPGTSRPQPAPGDPVGLPPVESAAKDRAKPAAKVPQLSIPIILLMAGLSLVLFSRGCNSINLRNVAKARAEVSQARRDEVSQDLINDLRKDADAASDNCAIWGYWLEWAFVLGTLVLANGLILCSFTATGATRLMCLVMTAIITFSLYVGGVAWIAALINSIGKGL
jgi:hypothetical protein